MAFARRLHLTDIERTVERFRNHYAAKPGRAGLSCDWSASFMNYAFEAADIEKRNENRNKPSQKFQYAI
jgi:hypothetical protein